MLTPLGIEGPEYVYRCRGSMLRLGVNVSSGVQARGALPYSALRASLSLLESSSGKEAGLRPRW